MSSIPIVFGLSELLSEMSFSKRIGDIDVWYTI